ncbi:MAG: polyphosphate kinase 1 [Lachnospira sp.]
MGRKCFENRELSWLKFNERVLKEALDTDNPLCERMNFLSIFSANLDEFFMVRVGSIHEQMLAFTDKRDNKTNMTPYQQLMAILKQVSTLTKKRDEAYDCLMKDVQAEGVSLINFAALKEDESNYLLGYFENEILPLLSPIVVGKKQPFPFLTSKEIYVLAVLEGKSEKEKIGIIPCNSQAFDRLIAIPGRDNTFMLAEELILHFIPRVFKKYRILEKSVIRIIRNADIDIEQVYDEDLNYCEHVSEAVKMRRKLSPVKLECSRELDKKTVNTLCEELDIKPNQVFLSKSPLDFGFFGKLTDVLSDNPKLLYEKYSPQPSRMVNDKEPVIPQIEKHDALLFFPYESIKPFTNMLYEAARDESVISIKMTLYRLAKHSKIAEALIEACENGKQVDVLVELKARFDEENNIEWSKRLEEAGCHIIYGFENLKVHSKLCLITRKTESGIEFISQIGTGNYNEKTAKLYTDLSLITADYNIGKQINSVFAALSLGEKVDHADNLLVAPNCFQNKIIEYIENETEKAMNGQPAYIGIKINSLTDKSIMEALIKASQAGVKIDMIIRGINCLRSKQPGMTDNIRIISIVGRFLEHARIYIFGADKDRKIYISSADFMTRSTLRRVEVAVEILDNGIKERIEHIFNIMLSDNVKAHEQIEDGSYVKVSELERMAESGNTEAVTEFEPECESESLKNDTTAIQEKINSQEIFIKEAKSR